jgi:hypothetical protein
LVFIAGLFLVFCLQLDIVRNRIAVEDRRQDRANKTRMIFRFAR